MNELVIGSNNLDEVVIRKYKDMLLTIAQDAVSWDYDVATGAMKYTFFDSANTPILSVVFEEFQKTITKLGLIYPDDEPAFNAFCEKLKEGCQMVSAEYRSVATNYDVCWFRIIGQARNIPELQDSLHIIGRRYDISREKNTIEDINTDLDNLTGLMKRDAVRKAINDSISAASEMNSALILVDVDDFHLINEANGKMQGDSVMQTISGIIFTNFMTKDLVGRIAGDQFIIYCDDIAEDKILDLLKSLNERIAVNVSMPDGSPATISVGVSRGPVDGDDFNLLYAKADIALCYAKQNGKNQVAIFDGRKMHDICIGYTMQKVGQFDDEDIRVAKVAGKRINKKLFDFAFEELSKEDNLIEAIRQIAKEVCLYYGMDRALVYELDKNTKKHIDVVARWCRIYDEDAENENLSAKKSLWEQIERATLDTKVNHFILQAGRGDGLDFFRDILEFKNVPASDLLFPLMDGDNLAALIAFEYFESHEFSNTQIATLNSIARLIRSYLINQQTKDEMEAESVIIKNVMDAQKVIYYIIDESTHTIKYVSQYARALFPQAEYGQKCYESLWGRQTQCEICPLSGGNGDNNMVQFYHEELDRWFSMTATRMQGYSSDKDILICITDVTDLLSKVRSEDPLTVASSFDSFIVNGQKLVNRTPKEYAVVSIGVRNFAKINDHYGYVIGDKILKRIAERVTFDLKEGEILCRIKGDDFIFLIKRISDEEHLNKVELLTKSLNDEFSKDCPAIDIQCFSGVYNIVDEKEHINSCIDKATEARNLAMADAQKSFGYFRYSEKMSEKSREDDETEILIKEALLNDRVVVFFQPKVDPDDGSIIGAEALVRMKDSSGNMISPGRFIPYAEKNGQIVKIDQVVYDKTFAYMAKWKKEGKKVPLVSVNVSRMQLFDDNLPECIKALSDKYDLEPGEIELEITESVFFEDTQRLVDMIRRLKAVGYVISMDDFGSGYSSLSFMKELPVDVIKIDGGFFMKNEMDKKSKAIISAILQLTQNLDFEAVSEGVETKEQVDFIREHGGRIVQGYYFYKPMSAEEFETLL